MQLKDFCVDVKAPNPFRDFLPSRKRDVVSDDESVESGLYDGRSYSSERPVPVVAQPSDPSKIPPHVVLFLLSYFDLEF